MSANPAVPTPEPTAPVAPTLLELAARKEGPNTAAIIEFVEHSNKILQDMPTIFQGR